MFCSQCGKELPGNSKFCSNCGKESINFSKNSSGIVMESEGEVSNMNDAPANADQLQKENTKDKKKNNWVLFF